MSINSEIREVARERTALDILSSLRESNAYLKTMAQGKIFDINTWTTIHNLTDAGFIAQYLSIGDTINDTWNDTAATKEYSFDWHIAHFGKVDTEKEEQVDGTFVQCHWAHPFGVQFSHQRAILACPDGLAAGTYYFTIERAWGNNVSAGDIVCFTLTHEVPSGGRIAGCYGAPEQVKSNWRIYVYEADGKTLIETITPTFAASGTSIGTVKSYTRNGNLNSMQEIAYGWNRWKTSALRQYLNSDKPKNEWWTAQDAWDIAPDQLSQKDGFLCGCSEDLRSSMRKVKIVTYPNTVNDDPAGNTPDITFDHVFLPSLENMYINPQKAGEGEVWDYWKAVNGTATKYTQSGTYPELKHYAVENHTSAQAVRLRSANRDNAYRPWSVNSSGNVGYNHATNAYRFAPACVI